MDNNIKSVSEVFIFYLEYLNQWNKSHSLTSIIEGVKLNNGLFNSDQLLLVCKIEYEDTQSITSDPILSVDEFLRQLLVKIRNEKINKIIS